MATSLYLISNINTSKEEVHAKKDIYLKKLKALHLEHTYNVEIINDRDNWIKDTGDWEYAFPFTYNEETQQEIPDEDATEIIYYSSPFVFNFTVYENCLVITTIYKYRFLYEDNKELFIDEFNAFRKNVFDIISIFGGTEIIYLADNGCNKLASYLELQVWEGVSYQKVKNNMLQDGTNIERDYRKLDIENLRYSNITEYIFDDFKDFK